ncbi:MAG: hypothetical protein AABW81_02320 [Nanoarchaeota archaeon]
MKIKADFIKGFFSGLVVIAFIWAIVFFITPETKGGVGTEKISFTLKEVHKTIDEDFAFGINPVYDEIFCKKKFLTIYNKEASSCYIDKIITPSRTNPLVIDIGCVCYD